MQNNSPSILSQLINVESESGFGKTSVGKLRPVYLPHDSASISVWRDVHAL